MDIRGGKSEIKHTETRRSSHFARELRQQPEAIRASLAAAGEGWQEIARVAVDVDRVLIVGSGDSYFLAHAVVPAFEALAGVPAEGVEAYDFVTTRSGAVSERTIVIAVSASGKAVRTLQAVEMAGRHGALTVGVTNNPDGPLAAAARVALVTRGGTSYSFPTKTTTAATAVIAGLAAVLAQARGHLDAAAARAEIEELATAVPTAIETILHPRTIDRLASAAEGLVACRHLVFVGSGAVRAAALVGAAKIHETVRRHALAANAEEYLHLIGFAAGTGDGVVVLASTGTADRERQVVEYAARQGALVVSLVRAGLAEDWPGGLVVPLPTDHLHPWSGAVVVMTALHLMAEHFSQVAGTNPDRPDTVDLDYVLGLLYTAPLEGW